MKSVKRKILFTVVCVIVLAVFNVVAFVAPFVREGSFWIGYGFTMFALILCIATTAYAFRGESLQSKFYGLPMPVLLWSYLIIQSILGLVFIVFHGIPTWISLIASILAAAFYLIGLISLDISADYIDNFDSEVKTKRFYIQSLQTDVEMLKQQTDDAILIKMLHELSDDFRYSDPMSSYELSSLENKIEYAVAELSTLVNECRFEDAKSQCGKIKSMLLERNKKCKLLK